MATLPSRIYTKMRNNTLLYCLAFGVAGVLPDIDHVIEGLERTFMFPFTVLAGLVCIVSLALDYRHIYKYRVN